MMDGAYHDLFVHPYCQDGVPLLELFVPSVIRVRVGESETIARAGALTK